jgi:16S rRNA (guanine527-N7)-methyltransferase
VRPRLAALGEDHGLDDRQLDRLDALLKGLANDRYAPTTVRDPARAVDVHLADSLAGLEVERLRSAGRIADIGAGAGFPGLPLAVALPASEVRLVESQARKCRFLRRTIASVGVDNVQVAECRVEEWSEGLGAHDAVAARALAPAPVVLEYAAPLLEMGGVLVDWRGRRDLAQEAEAAAAAEQLGMRLLEIRHTEPYAGAREHHLHVFEKVVATPSRFPRRAGVARKRPLGG